MRKTDSGDDPWSGSCNSNDDGGFDTEVGDEVDGDNKQTESIAGNYLKIQSYKLKKQIIAYVFQKYPEKLAL